MSPMAHACVQRRLRLLLPLLMVAISGCFSPVRAVPTPTPWPTPVLSEQESYQVARGRVEDRFQLIAEVAPLRWEPLAFAVDGQLAAVHVREGEAAEEGEILAELIMPDLLEQLEQARLDLSKAESVLWVYENKQSFNLERAQLEVRSAELMLAQARNGSDADQISLQEVALELAQLNLRETESRVDPSLEQAVERAQLAVDALERQVEERRLRAPFAGQVVAVGVGLASMRGPLEPPERRAEVPAFSPFMVIVVPQPVELIVSSQSARASDLAVGQRVTAVHRWAQDKPFPVRVAQLPIISSGDRFTPGFPGSIHLTVEGDSPQLVAGEFVNIEVVAAVQEDTLILPDAAVRRFGGRTFVVVQDGDRQRRVDIRIGLESQGMVEVLEGLNEGDIVVGR
ncbi:MAG: biotin/lipoyl-binding protein [Caldilineaceae bacterium]|nr:biotin/lipoyl-binding protein [Caldilineaceae bacterium]MCY4116367.1 biotin/lipoyl-binding protein [Caldilineaceae bacterium]